MDVCNGDNPSSIMDKKEDHMGKTREEKLA
jgi:hypothetical protein